MRGEQRRAVTRLGLLGDADGNAQLAAADRAPRRVARAAADADNATQGRRAQTRELRVGERLDTGDALEKALNTTVELAMLGKHRQGGVVRTEAFVGNVEGRTCVIVDDLIVTGTTLIRAADACRNRGATAVHAMATHGAFTAAAGEVLASPLIKSITITDAISPDRIDLGPAREKLSVLSIAPLLARAVGAMHHERSITAAMEEPL